MKRALLAPAFLAIASLSPIASAQVFINEVFINPPGSLDTNAEFVELQGTPGMKLDGFAIALVSGNFAKYYPLNSIPPLPLQPEIDEYFALDGLALGGNGLLVIAITGASSYPTLTPDTTFEDWNNLWNGLGGGAGKLQNDGSTTVLLIRGRPGQTPADPSDVLGMIWKKGAFCDSELITPVFDNDTSTFVDQFGDGHLDHGQPDGMLGTTVNMIGDGLGLEDQLEIVDEVSFEQDRGWEYDFDSRRVDINSPVPGLKQRTVHALSDPQGIQPDCISRVDYRTKGNGWTPAPGATGQMANGKNWQDTATEQWVRGESVGSSPFFYDVTTNPDPNSIQPYLTNVPLWLADGQGVDFSFTTNSYQIAAGRVNALAIPFIPGDVNRDGVCDAQDITKIRAVFGSDDFVFSNASATAPEGDGGDPATQTRPWDVNETGDNGIECSDLQWALNFQGNTNGRIIGKNYDGTGPSASGVALNSGSGVNVAMTTAVTTNCGRPLSAIRVGDAVEVLVKAQVNLGANITAGQQNGVMQFIQDLAISTGNVLKVESIDRRGPFDAINANTTLLNGSGGDLGALSIDGYTTDFTRGISGAVDLYRVTLRAIGAGSANVTLSAATETRYAASTPRGVKVGHTASNGDPATSTYPAPIAITVVPFTGDGYLKPYGTASTGLGGYKPILRGSGCAVPGGSITLRFERSTGGLVPFVFFGLGHGVANVNVNTSMQVLPLLFPTPLTFGTLAPAGAGNGELIVAGLPIPPSAPVGFLVTAQAFYADVSVTSSNPLDIYIGL